MDEQQFREWINTFLPTLKLFVKAFKDKDQWRSFIEYMNNLPKNQIQNFYDEYKNLKREKINRVRITILERLLDWSLTYEDAVNIFEDEKKLWEPRTLKNWTIPRIVYPFCYWEKKHYEKFTEWFLKEVCDYVVEEASYDRNKITEPWSVTFDWANNFWKNWFYVGFWNNTHPDYTTQDQFRIESEWDDKLNVWIYHHKKWFIGWKYKKFDLDSVTLKDIVDEAKECKDIVESDIYSWPIPEKKQESKTPLSPKSASSMTSIALNTILYWVPGTGKTYNTVNYAVAAIEWKNIEDVCKEDRNIVKERYNQYKSEWQIVFTTFHQSFWYEDFIEGIKAKVEDNWNISYEVESWIFKNLCEVAQSEENINTTNSNVDIEKANIFKMSLWEVWRNDEVYDYCIDNNLIALWFSNYDFTNLKWNSSKDVKDFIKENYKEATNLDTNFLVDAMFRFKLRMKKWDIVLISNGNNYLRAIWKVTSDYFYDENSPIEYKHFRKVEWLLKDVNIPVERINNKKFSQQSIYNLKDNSYKQTPLKLDELKALIWGNKSWEKRNYVLIIDEINRWNISKIFWELITLIEPNKRLWWPEQIKVKLPYSQKEFWVPNNLYILWTMNTADRSIALMDLALRRRFKFREIEPNSELLDWIIIDWINIKELFETLNKRIEFLYDRDHLLGHAYFLPLKKEPTLEKLNSIMLDNVVPLLQEYFHDDWEKIQLVLWEWIVKSEMMSAKGLWINNSEYEDYPKYVINTHLSAQDYSY